MLCAAYAHVRIVLAPDCVERALLHFSKCCMIGIVAMKLIEPEPFHSRPTRLMKICSFSSATLSK